MVHQINFRGDKEKECQYGDFDFAGYIQRIGRGNEIY